MVSEALLRKDAEVRAAFQAGQHFLGRLQSHTMDKACDIEAADLAERSLSQQVTDPANLPLPGTLDQEATLGRTGESVLSVQTFVNHLHEGTARHYYKILSHNKREIIIILT